MNKTNKIKHLLTILSFVPALGMSQTTTENYVKTMTMLDANEKNSIKSVQYYNGLGYPTVSVANVGGKGETAYSLTTYDALGREECKYLPVSTDKSILYKTPEKIIESLSDKTAFSLNHYDALNRVTSVELPGKEWRDADKRNRMEYSTNIKDEVLHYMAIPNPEGGYFLLKPGENGNPYPDYPAGTLTKEISKDADDNTVETFKDLFGNVILQRTVLDNNTNLDTYYVYDAIGQLCYVLPPKYQKSGYKTTNAYEYRYDNKGRLYKKRLPGCEIIQYWYDNADRVVAMQDGVMKKNKKFRFMIYDNLGRLVVQGLCSLYNHNEKLNDNCVVARFDKGNEGFLNTSYVIPEYFQKSLTNPTLEIVNYYDRNQDSIKGNIKKKFSSIKLSTTVSQIGQLTGCMAMVGSSDYVSKVMVYDIKGNLTKSKMREIGGRIVTHNSSYTFTNNPKYSKYTIDVKYGDKMIVYDSLFYNSYNNKMKRHALAISHGDNKATSSISYTYDNLGRTSTLSRPSSEVSYTYDMRGWLKNITTNSFKEDLFYADWTYPTSTKDATVHKCYNGNIAAIRWSNDNYNQVRGYRFVYDKANRLTDALYGERADLNNKTNRYNEVLEYDENGNITNLQRRGLKQDGEYGKIDNLNLKYDGNHLSSVEEDAKDYDYAGSFEYKKLNGTDYKYNENGSLVADKSRGIAYIRYDFNNNPEMIYFTNGNTTEYVYSASGEKLRVIHNTAKYNVITRTVGTEVKGKLDPTRTQYSDTTDYLLGGSLVMKNGKIDKYLFEGGYAQAGPLYSGCVAKPMTFYFEEDEDTTPSSGLVRAEVAAFYFEEDEDTTPSSKKATSSSNNTTSSSNNATTTSVYDEWRKAQEAMHTADYFTFNFYNQDHLGNNREVVDEYGYVSQVTNYYPFGAPYADATAVKDADFQPYKYNGKELDLMHGLNTYDYGARQHDPILARWDRIDPHCEKYYNVSPYAYCHNNPVMMIDPDGKDDYKIDGYGNLSFWRRSNAKSTDRIYASNGQKMTVSKAIRESLMTGKSDYKDGNYAVGSKNMDKLFKFVADNTCAEWRLVGYNTDKGKKYVLMTTHDHEGVEASNELAGMKERNMEFDVHSHPTNCKEDQVPSGYEKPNYYYGDKVIANDTSARIAKEGGKVPRFYMYHTGSQKLVRYDKDRIINTTIIKDGKFPF